MAGTNVDSTDDNGRQSRRPIRKSMLHHLLPFQPGRIPHGVVAYRGCMTADACWFAEFATVAFGFVTFIWGDSLTWRIATAVAAVFLLICFENLRDAERRFRARLRIESLERDADATMVRRGGS